jgi:hypothetical protein
MHRRNILKGMAAIIALQSHPLARFAAKGATTSAFSRVPPGDAAWPSAASWAKLNETVGRQFDRGAIFVWRLHKRSRKRALRRRSPEHPQPVLHRRPTRGHAGFRNIAARPDLHRIDVGRRRPRIEPAAGSDVAESNYFNASWQDAFWGPNYLRLRAMEASTIQSGLMSCGGICVGTTSEIGTAPGGVAGKIDAPQIGPWEEP